MTTARITVICIVVFFMNNISFAGSSTQKDTVDGGWSFDRNLEYDIIFSTGEDSSSTVEDVQILGFQEFAGKKFLVIQSKGFKLQDGRGFILFDAVMAILPNGNFFLRKQDNRPNFK